MPTAIMAEAYYFTLNEKPGMLWIMFFEVSKTVFGIFVAQIGPELAWGALSHTKL